ncbi:hypothetical protein QP752_11260, partial [Corynebacterium sp. UMB10321]|nr:hypothetical protein [Corynebacterium sp. UMB10321]
FVAFWGLFFALTGVLGGLMQETTRAIGAAEARNRKRERPREQTPEQKPEQEQEQTATETGQTLGARPITVSLGVAAVTFITMAVTGPLWA